MGNINPLYPSPPLDHYQSSQCPVPEPITTSLCIPITPSGLGICDLAGAGWVTISPLILSPNTAASPGCNAALHTVHQHGTVQYSLAGHRKHQNGGWLRQQGSWRL